MLSPLLWPRAGMTVFRTFGAAGAARRLEHEFRRARSGFRREPRYPGGFGAVTVNPFQVKASELADATEPGAALSRADRIVAGEYQAYRSEWRSLPASPEGWLIHPRTGARATADLPWWRTEHLGREFGDIKDLWEPARFGWAYDLVRGYVLSGDARFVGAFEQHFDDWLESSPPFQGPHWSCGQETAIRAAALLYAEANLQEPDDHRPALWGRVRAVLAASGERIADAFGYALSQRNNHGISEAAGLIMLGVRFRSQHPEAEQWLAQGREHLDRLIREQFAPDGWYIQHSFTYLRVALDLCVLAEHALQSVGQSLSHASANRLRAAIELLLAVVDPATGRVPNYGPNDGAFVHPITLAQYRDFRPVLTAACATWNHPLPIDIEVDQEVLVWLGLEPPPRAPALEDGVRNGASGWAAARLGRTLVFMRAGRYSSRPGHVDPLHLDIRIQGSDVVVDPGTYSYNAPPPWQNGLAGSEVHNGPVVDGAEPGVRGPRFLWLLWPEADLVRVTNADGRIELVGRVQGSHERTVRVTADRVIVEDSVLNPSAQELRVRWLLGPEVDPDQFIVEGAESRTIHVDESSTAGWYSPHYGSKVPTRMVELRHMPSNAKPGLVSTFLAAQPSATESAAVAGESESIFPI